MPEMLSYAPEEEKLSSMKSRRLNDLHIQCASDVKCILEDRQGFELLAELPQEIDKILGTNHNPSEKITISLFSDRKRYEDFLEMKFPQEFETYRKDNAIFDLSQKTGEKNVVSHTPIKKISALDQFRLAKNGMTVEQAKEIIQETARANILSSVAHELAHLHPFFGGVGNSASSDKWQQEMVCIFIGEKVRTAHGGENFRKELFKKAQQEIKDGQLVDLEQDGKDWDNIKTYEQFFYPYLEKEYGLEKLQELWRKLFKEKENFNVALQLIYGQEASVIQEKFKESMTAAKNRQEVEL